VASIRAGYQVQDLAAPSGLIASRPIWVAGIEPLQNPGSMQKVVNQRVDHNERGTDSKPQRPAFPRSQTNLR
jgi:hypothetical protein